MNRVRLAAFAAGLLAASPGLAQDANPPLAVQRFEPTPSPSDFLVTFGAPELPAFGYSLGIFTDLQNDPLSVRFVFFNDGEPTLGGDAVQVVKNQLVTHLVGAVSLFSKVELGFDLPFFVLQSGEGLSPAGGAGQGVPSGGLGDPKIHLRSRFYAKEISGGTLALGGVGTVSLPLGNEGGFMGEAGITGTARLIADYQRGKLRGAANLGYRARPNTVFQTLVLADELLYSFAGSYEFIPKVAGSLELYGASSASPDLRDLDSSPLELDLAGRYQTTGGLALTGGVGAGLKAGAGSPDVRFFAGVRFSPNTSGDPDNDGFIGADDECPRKPETKNKYKDNDGCPDQAPGKPFGGAEKVIDANDEDADGIPNGADQCPDLPEDSDKFQDEDGCPDNDNDNDGIIDAKDECRNEAEDLDGTDDNDGCVDFDNDNDGILDTDETCPNEPEDADGHADQDGCPELDADQDGVNDDVDPCPDAAETFNGLSDDDGCPDEGASNLSFPASGKGEISGGDKITFQKGKVQLAADALPVLDELVSRLRAAPRLALVIRVAPEKKKKVGEKDQKLAAERAEGILGYLIGFGIEPERLRMEEGGEPGSGTKLLLENAPPAP
jgi:outer membrane protein OmpA-like peptidoglycan-associated protein